MTAEPDPIGGALLGYDPPLDSNWWNIEPEEKDEE